MKKIFFTTLLFVLTLQVSMSQVDREFWFAIPKITSGHGSLTSTNNVSLKITALSLDANVTITMPSNPLFVPIYLIVKAGETRSVVLATNWADFAKIYNNVATYNVSTVSGKSSNGGLHIESDAEITAYYDFDNTYNREMFSLKGKNALGTEFFTPFQNIWLNDSTGYTPKPYSAIDIVATEDNTIVTIIPRRGQQIDGRANDSAYSIVLNRGEGYTIRAKYMAGRAHLSGLKITSDKKIAVTISDDSVRQSSATCRDINGDQLVPTNLLGSTYLVLTGNKANTTGTLTPPYKYPNGVGEQIFITAAQPNTIIDFYNSDGMLLYRTPVLDAGGTDYLSVDINNPKMASIVIKSTDETKKFYVYHLTGILCETGGAIVPPLNNCNGSYEVSFYRSETVNDMVVNMMVPYDTTLAFSDISQAYHYFSLLTFNIDGSIASIVNLPDSLFEPVTQVGWAVLKMKARNFNSLTTMGRAHKIVNLKRSFHMGFSNGTIAVTNKYGYFSEFNEILPNVYIPGEIDTELIRCYGDSIQLVAFGGTNYYWHYGTPNGNPTYISDFNSATSKIINCPEGEHQFFVEIKNNQCFGVDTIKINVNILPVPKLKFNADTNSLCSGNEIKVLNQNDCRQQFSYLWLKSSNQSDWDTISMENTMYFSDMVINENSEPTDFAYKITESSIYGCGQKDTIFLFNVYPKLKANFYPKDTTGNSPFSISFKDSTLNSCNAQLTWNFGEGSYAYLKNPTVTFYNTLSVDTMYRVLLYVQNQACVDSVWGFIKVKGEKTDYSKQVYISGNYSIYPVPAKNTLFVEFNSDKNQNLSLLLISMDGKIFSTYTVPVVNGINKIPVNVSEISDKMFLLNIKSGRNTENFKILKE